MSSVYERLLLTFVGKIMNLSPKEGTSEIAKHVNFDPIEEKQ